MNVLPASMPFASCSTMVIVGPSARSRWIAMPSATSAASAGMIQMMEMRRRFRRVTAAFGRSSCSGCSAMRGSMPDSGVPDEPRVERFRRQHRQYDDGSEEQHAGAWRDRREGGKLHERDGERRNEDVEHRPAADEFDDAVELRALPVVGDGAALDGDQQIGERYELAERDHHARDE